MGTYATAEIFYGYKWDYDEDEVESDGFDFKDEWESHLLGQLGVEDLDYSDYPNYGDGDYQGKYAAWREKNKGAMKARDDAHKAVRDEFKCEQGSTGYLLDGCGGHTLYIRGTDKSVDYGSKAIDPTDLEIDPSWESELNRLLDRLGLKAPQDHPQWWLSASYR